MSKAVVLLSGGLDSTTCLAIGQNEGYECHALSVDYGQKHRIELAKAARIASTFNVVTHKIVRLDLQEMGGSALTDETIDVPNYVDSDAIPVTYVPARNSVFLSIALGYAEVLEADAIFIGVSSIDYSGYPDCRPEYIDAFQQMANLATKRGIEGKPIIIKTPLIHLDKAQTIKIGVALGVDYSQTVSCYKADEKGYACGLCDSCVLRKKGFMQAGMRDLTYYKNE